MRSETMRLSFAWVILPSTAEVAIETKPVTPVVFSPLSLMGMELPVALVVTEPILPKTTLPLASPAPLMLTSILC